MRIKFSTRCLCYITLLFLCTSLYAQIQNDRQVFYFHGNNVSVINAPNSKKSYFTIGNQRISTQIVGKKISKYFIGDGKNIRLIMTNQTHTQTEDFKPYGRNISKTTEAHIAFGYNTEYTDPSTQFIYLRARDYKPNTMHFTTSDSYAIWNKYAFDGGNPINHIDPSGHSFTSWWSKQSNVTKGLIITSGSLVVAGLLGYAVKRWRAEPEVRMLPAADEIHDAARAAEPILNQNSENFMLDANRTLASELGIPEDKLLAFQKNLLFNGRSDAGYQNVQSLEEKYDAIQQYIERIRPHFQTLPNKIKTSLKLAIYNKIYGDNDGYLKSLRFLLTSIKRINLNDAQTDIFEKIGNVKMEEFHNKLTEVLNNGACAETFFYNYLAAFTLRSYASIYKGIPIIT